MPIACPTMEDSARIASRTRPCSEAFLEALRHPEYASETADVLTDEHDGVVVVHQFMQRAVERFGQATRLGVDHGAKAFQQFLSSPGRHRRSTSPSHSSSTTPAATNVWRYLHNGIVRDRRGEFFWFAVAGVGIGRGVSSDARGPQLDEAGRLRSFDVAPRLEATEIGAVGIVGRDRTTTEYRIRWRDRQSRSASVRGSASRLPTRCSGR